MPRYKLTQKAELDLVGIIDHTIANWGAAQAEHYAAGLERMAAMLADRPALGRPRDKIAQGLLVFPYEQHLLFYYKAPHGITVVRILHGSMDAPRWLISQDDIND